MFRVYLFLKKGLAWLMESDLCFSQYGYPVGIILGNARPLEPRSRFAKGVMLRGFSISLFKMFSYPIQV